MFKNSNDPWSLVKKRHDDSDSEESRLISDDFEDGTVVERANHALLPDGDDKSRWIVLDSESNRPIFKSREGFENYQVVAEASVATASSDGRLTYVGCGHIGKCKRVLHAPDASANLVPTTEIAKCNGAKTILVPTQKNKFGA